jgi:hypothetical protein
MVKVELAVYDLSNGMASAMSESILGKRIDGIWHTGVSNGDQINTAFVMKLCRYFSLRKGIFLRWWHSESSTRCFCAVSRYSSGANS